MEKTSTNSNAQVDLVRLFNSVTSTLKQNQPMLNDADEYNHNHGDNMVDTFQAITQAMRAKKGSPPTDQLAYASEVVSQRSQSGSSQLYSQGLAKAADQFQGKSAITQADALLLVQALLGGQTAAPQSEGSGMDFLSDLLGGQSSGQQGQSSGGDLLGGLLGTLMGGTSAGQSNQSSDGQMNQGIDINTLLTAGMAFFQARQRGVEPVNALVQAVMAGSQMKSSAHRSQSGQLVAETLITTLGKMLSGKNQARR